MARYISLFRFADQGIRNIKDTPSSVATPRWPKRRKWAAFRGAIVAVCVCNRDRSPVGINRWDAAPTPTGFAEIVSDNFPVINGSGFRLFCSPQSKSFAECQVI